MGDVPKEECPGTYLEYYCATKGWPFFSANRTLFHHAYDFFGSPPKPQRSVSCRLIMMASHRNSRLCRITFNLLAGPPRALALSDCHKSRRDTSAALAPFRPSCGERRKRNVLKLELETPTARG